MSKIEWTEKTWNPLAGCTEVSPGCTNCYAAKMAFRLGHMGQAAYADLTKKLPNGRIVWTGDVRLLPERLQEPLQRKSPTTYFVNSMSDLFHKDVPFEFINQVFAVMMLAGHHTFQVLTKRAERMEAYFSQAGVWNRIADEMAALHYAGEVGFSHGTETEIDLVVTKRLPKNIWIGVSVENQKSADERIPYLLQVPAAVRFLSCEPLLGPVDLSAFILRPALHLSPADLEPSGLLHWVICGGESGPGARPMHPDWTRSLRDQCAAAGVAFFFKQWGAWIDAENWNNSGALSPKNGFIFRATPRQAYAEMNRAGKAKTGRTLDGREHNDMPVPFHKSLITNK